MAHVHTAEHLTHAECQIEEPTRKQRPQYTRSLLAAALRRCATYLNAQRSARRTLGCGKGCGKGRSRAEGDITGDHHGETMENMGDPVREDEVEEFLLGFRVELVEALLVPLPALQHLVWQIAPRAFDMVNDVVVLLLALHHAAQRAHVRTTHLHMHALASALSSCTWRLCKGAVQEGCARACARGAHLGTHALVMVGTEARRAHLHACTRSARRAEQWRRAVQEGCARRLCRWLWKGLCGALTPARVHSELMPMPSEQSTLTNVAGTTLASSSKTASIGRRDGLGFDREGRLGGVANGEVDAAADERRRPKW